MADLKKILERVEADPSDESAQEALEGATALVGLASEGDLKTIGKAETSDTTPIARSIKGTAKEIRDPSTWKAVLRHPACNSAATAVITASVIFGGSALLGGDDDKKPESKVIQVEANPNDAAAPVKPKTDAASAQAPAETPATGSSGEVQPEATSKTQPTNPAASAATSGSTKGQFDASAQQKQAATPTPPAGHVFDSYAIVGVVATADRGPVMIMPALWLEETTEEEFKARVAESMTAKLYDPDGPNGPAAGFNVLLENPFWKDGRAVVIPLAVLRNDAALQSIWDNRATIKNDLPNVQPFMDADKGENVLAYRVEGYDPYRGRFNGYTMTVDLNGDRVDFDPWANGTDKDQDFRQIANVETPVTSGAAKPEPAGG